MEDKQAFGYITERPIWYHGTMGRVVAEDALMGKPDGTFLIRDSSSSNGDYVLSASESARVSHYIIKKQGADGYMIGDESFRDLFAVLEFYKTHLLDTTTLSLPLPFGAGATLGASGAVCSVRALFNFTAKDHEDLSFRKGDIMDVVEKHEDQWWRAKSRTTQKVGCIPVNYVEEIQSANPPPKTSLPPPARAEPKFTPPPSEQRQAYNKPAVRAPPPVQAAAAAPARQMNMPAANDRAMVFFGEEPPPASRPDFIAVRAILDRVANAYDNTALSFKTGDIIRVSKQNENGLWEGSLVSEGVGGKIGHFPFTLVELLDCAEYDEAVIEVQRVFEAVMDDIYGTVP